MTLGPQHVLRFCRRIDPDPSGPLHTFVETGTYLGDTTAQAAQRYNRVHTIEASPQLHAMAVRRFAETPNVTCHFGSSPAVLAALDVPQPAVFYLDAHWQKADAYEVWDGEPVPLWEELDVILKRPYADIIAIDDLHSFGSDKTHPRWLTITIPAVQQRIGARLARSEAFWDHLVCWLT